MAIIEHDEDLLDRAAMVAMRGLLKLSPGLEIAPEGRRAYDALIERTPAPEGVEWREATASGVPGWLCVPADAVPGRAILYLHGGGHVIGSARAYRGFASHIAARARAATFVADYRLAPEHPFPAAFDDACRALDGLRADGFMAIAVVGDSAGGGLALAMLASGAASTRAAAAALLSPWTDLSLGGDTIESRRDADPILTPEGMRHAAAQYLQGADPADARINAMKGDWSRLPPLRVDIGDDELLLSDALGIDAPAAAAGVPCEVHVWKGMTHVFPTNVAMLKAAPEALDGIGAFLEAAFGRSAG